MKTKLSIILPAKDEEQLIKKTLTEIVYFLKRKKYAYEIIVVINGTTDTTEKISSKFAKMNKKVLILKSEVGYGKALKKGLRMAKGDFVIVFNVDFYDLNMIDLIDINMYGKDLIIGSKRAHWSKDSRPSFRKIVSTLFNSYLRLNYGFIGSDTHGIKLMNRRLLERVLPRCKTNSGIFDTELVLKSQKLGFKIADFPVEVKELRPSRFKNRLISTPNDIYQLQKHMQKYARQ